MAGTITGTIMTTSTRQVVSAAVSLILLATILPELLSGNTPAHVLFTPGPFLFLIVAYGLPVLVIREFAVRHGLGLAGLFMIGLGYGLINEALLAKTVFREVGGPVEVYAGYGFASGVHWAWSAFILPWHAMDSVILPILFAHLVQPAVSARPWLGVKFAVVIAVLLFALITLFHIAEDTSGIPGTFLSAAVLWCVIAALAFLGRRLPGDFVQSPARHSKWKLWLLGFSGIIPFLSLLAIANMQPPRFLYFATAFVWIIFYRWLMQRFATLDHPAFGWFGLGWYMSMGIFSWIEIAPRLPYMVAADIAAFAAIFAILHRRKGMTP
jgi:hypothetical protein